MRNLSFGLVFALSSELTAADLVLNLSFEEGDLMPAWKGTTRVSSSKDPATSTPTIRSISKPSTVGDGESPKPRFSFSRTWRSERAKRSKHAACWWERT